MGFEKKAKPQNPVKKQEKKDILKNSYALFEGRKRVLDAFKNKILPIKIEGADFSHKVSDHSSLKILILKQMLQRLPIALALDLKWKDKYIALSNLAFTIHGKI